MIGNSCWKSQTPTNFSMLKMAVSPTKTSDLKNLQQINSDVPNVLVSANSMVVVTDL